MTGMILTLWITLACAAPSPDFPGAVPVVRFDFAAQAEGDFNKPLGWVRYDADQFPFYIQADLTDEADAAGGRSLRFLLNGGNCAMFSPTFPAASDYNYVVRGQIKVDGLKHDRALLVLQFLDETGEVVGKSHVSQWITGTEDWSIVQIGPVAAPEAHVHAARIGCLTLNNQTRDLTGKAYFDDIRVGRLPRFEVSTSGPFRLFEIAEPKRASIAVRGTENRQLLARFSLFDATRRPLADATMKLAPQGDSLVAEWEIPAQEPGFYHLDVALEEGTRQILKRAHPITILAPASANPRGDFGLSLPTPHHGLAQYDRLLAFSASRWVKIPFWSGEELTMDERQFADFLERLNRRGHQIVAGLDAPPRPLLELLARSDARILDVFALPPNAWTGFLEEQLVRYGLRVSHWQLGSDSDRSFESVASPNSFIDRVHKQASELGREPRLGLTWSLSVPPPDSPNLSFVTLTDRPPEIAMDADWTPLSADDLLEQIKSVKETVVRRSPPQKNSSSVEPLAVWVQLAPLAADRYGRRDRIIDLARRAVASKVAGAEMILAVDVAHPQRGLMDADGAPTELFTIWRTLAEHLSGKSPIGSLPIVGDARNELFVGDGQVTMVLWADQPAVVEAVVGREAAAVDLWGRAIPGTEGLESRKIPVDDMPVLITNVDEFLARFQLGVRFERGSATSRFGVHEDRLTIQNPLPVAISGTVVPEFPRAWTQRPQEILLQVGPQAEAAFRFAITLPQGVPQRDYQVPIDFRVSGTKNYRFRLYRPFRIGGDELRVDAQSRLLPSGDLQIEATVTNITSSTFSLNASARALGRKAELDFISALAGGATASARFVFPDGRDLLGRTVELKFEDVSGRREFSFDIPITP